MKRLISYSSRYTGPDGISNTYSATLDGGVTFHYYTQDYLGNNRAVINGSTGTIEQAIAYYPYGGVICALGSTTGSPNRR